MSPEPQNHIGKTLRRRSTSLTLGGDLAVARIGFGAMRLCGPGIWGWPRDPEAARMVLRRAIELGITLIDTADAYGPEVNELLIAETLHPYPEELVIATKGGLTRPWPGAWENDGRPEYLRVACDGSLRRLKLERIDVNQLHAPDPRVPLEESVGALADLRAEGKIRHIGISNVSVDELRRARGLVPIATVQNRYNYADRSSEEVLRECERESIIFLPWYPLEAGGSASGTGTLARLGARYNASPAQIAIAWLLARSPITLPIPGTSSVAHNIEGPGDQHRGAHRAAGRIQAQPKQGANHVLSFARHDPGLGRPGIDQDRLNLFSAIQTAGLDLARRFCFDLWAMRTLADGFVPPCLPMSAAHPPCGPEWLREIKHDGFRCIARKDGQRVKLYSRPGNDLTDRFPLIVAALASLRARSCILDGEAVACGDDGIANFNHLRYRRHDAEVLLYAFDLIELNGDDLRRDPLQVRKATLASLLARSAPGVHFNEHMDHADGPLVFAHACMMRLEGIVSKHRHSPYSSGRSPHWIKSKNPNAPAVKRETEEDWGKWPSVRARASRR